MAITQGGLWLPDDDGVAAREEPPANPKSQPGEPPPGFLKDLASLARRVGVEYRPHWYRQWGVWTIQMRRPGRDGSAMGWETILVVQDHTRATQKHPRVYRPLDNRTIQDLAEACRQIQYNTGDPEKDEELADKATDDRIAAEEAAERVRENIEAAELITGGDHVRFGKLLRHEQIGPSDGTGFKEFWSVPGKGGDVGGGGA